MKKLVLCAALCLCGCGFQLRGADGGIAQMQDVLLQTKNAGRIDKELRQQAAVEGIQPAAAPGRAVLILELRDERFQKRSLSVSAQTGKIEEYELSYEVQATVSAPQGGPILPALLVQTRADYVFLPRNTVLGELEQEQLLQQELVRRAAVQVLDRLRVAVRPPGP